MSLGLGNVRRAVEEAIPLLSAESAVLGIEARSATVVGDTHGDLETTTWRGNKALRF
ncbi:hypothetical protein HRbin02_00837 [Candidatus Calditenuaceae archaeon HR02]|nr:hypothetical protein HRbin02_00837 [Candidatus Calditenuaceae archaeon HR02]